MGLNIGENEGDPGYDVVYEEQIKKLLAVDPDANVYVNSIIPATPAALQKSPRWDKVDAFNAKIKAMCDRNGWTYIDNDALAQGGQANIYQKMVFISFSHFIVSGLKICIIPKESGF